MDQCSNSYCTNERISKGNKRKVLYLVFSFAYFAKMAFIKDLYSVYDTDLNRHYNFFYYQVLMDNIVPSLSIEMLNYVSAITLSLFLVQICLNFLEAY